MGVLQRGWEDAPNVLAALAFLLLLQITGAAGSQCPLKLDCAIRRRLPCPPGSRDCGACIPPLVEQENTCVQWTLHEHEERHSKVARPDDIIDLIQSLLAESQKPTEDAGIGNKLEAHVTERLSTVVLATETQTSNSSETPVTTGLPEPTKAEIYSEPVMQGRRESQRSLNEAVSMTLVIICTITGFSGLVVAGLCWYRLQREVHLAQKMAYTAYRGTRRRPTRPGDVRLAQSIQVHHYQRQKKTILSMEEGLPKSKKQLSLDSEVENENGEYTVYECPGLAPTGEMEIHNPLFDSSVLHHSPGPASK
nr:PREDICTED: neural proliferation differentiation and control protein 1-like isoform X2 [Latimeria chalumnae]|eukprot:XP_005998186.1 PREDICTED: neural proliferation differentiation and control protein 1-like isoform X2 [Latimeria chalumnae]